MGIYRKLYEFAASAGAFEGYVYSKNAMDKNYLPRWVAHLKAAYGQLEDEVRKEIQPSLNGTLGRAIQSLLPELGEDNVVIKTLKSMVVGDKLPGSPDDFEKEKWFEKG